MDTIHGDVADGTTRGAGTGLRPLLGAGVGVVHDNGSLTLSLEKLFLAMALSALHLLLYKDEESFKV